MVLLIGIAGPSNSGKSTLAASLSEVLPAAWLEVDHYLKDFKDIPVQGSFRNWELPQNHRWNDVLEDVEALRQGKSIRHPVYSFSRGFVKDYRVVEPCDIILVEGFYVLTFDMLRHMFDKSLYLDISDDVLLSRRECQNSGSDWDSEQYVHEIVIPNFARYGLIQKEYAELVLDGTLSKQDILTRAFDYLNSK